MLPREKCTKEWEIEFFSRQQVVFCQVLFLPPPLHLFLYKQRILLKSASSNSLKNVDSKYKVIICKYNIIAGSLASLIRFFKKAVYFKKNICIKRMICLFQQAQYEDVVPN